MRSGKPHLRFRGGQLAHKNNDPTITRYMVCNPPCLVGGGVWGARGVWYGRALPGLCHA